MCEGVKKYFKDNSAQLRRRREKMERKQKRLEWLTRQQMKKAST